MCCFFSTAITLCNLYSLRNDELMKKLSIAVLKNLGVLQAQNGSKMLIQHFFN